MKAAGNCPGFLRQALFFAVFSLLSVVAYPQQDENEKAAETERQRESGERRNSTAPDGAGDATRGQRNSAPDSRFRPTEEISEDLSVPFPVDI